MPKLSDLKSQIVWLLISVLCFISALAMPYFEGRSNSSWQILPLIPAELAPPLLLLISSVVLLCYTIVSFSTRQNLPAGLAMFLGSAALSIAWFFVFVHHWYFYQLGLTDYARSILTTAEWRDISRFAHEKLDPNDYLWGPRKGHQNENERELWSEFTNHTEIQKLGPYVMIYVRTNPKSQDEYTQIMWGGALAGHWGVVIYSNTNDTDISRPPSISSQPMFIAPDIATFIAN